MYSEYKKRVSSATNTSQNSCDVVAANEEDVKRIWDEIEEQCDTRGSRNHIVAEDKSRAWKTIRVFVSSTFTDFHNEREILVKKVSQLMVHFAT